jgi:hypothetical protein
MRLVAGLVVSFLGGLVFTAPVAAANKSVNGQQLLNACLAVVDVQKREDSAARSLLCLGYVTAVLDGLSGGNSINGKKACVPDTVESDHMIGMVVNTFLSRPYTRDQLAAGLVADALASAYPCP